MASTLPLFHATSMGGAFGSEEKTTFFARLKENNLPPCWLL